MREEAFGFSRAHRLRKRAEFTACYDAGQRCFSRSFALFVRARGDAGPWRLGLAVTRKVGNAVRRNRVKRIVREFFRLYGREVPAGADIVVTARRGLDPRNLTLDQAVRELLPLMRSRRTRTGERS